MDSEPHEPVPAYDGPPPADTLLTDGSIAVVRSMVAADGDQLLRLHRELSDDTLRLRFFSAARGSADAYVDHLLRTVPLTLVVEQGGRVLALATAEPVGPNAAEVSFLVEDGRHGLGIGSLLLEHLAAAAWQRGVTTFVAEVLLENRGMLGVFTDAGFALVRATSQGVVDLRVDLTPSALSAEVADARERRAEARSLHPLLHPHGVVVVGVRSDGSGVGRALLDSIRLGGFQGEVYAVHPRLPVIPGVQVVADFDELPHPVDLAVVAVPADRVVAAVTDAAGAGVPAVVVISSGFQELGAEGARLQRELAHVARSLGVRLVGPNCMGLMDNAPEMSLNATFSRSVPPDGGLAVATQSGGVGIVLTGLANDLGLGIGSLVSLGNKVDVSGNDLVAAWTDDPRVTAAALYLESFGNARKFARLARRFSERKPLLAVVGGRSDGGRRAGASHTAAGMTPQVGVTAMFGSAGVIACETAEDLVETALLMTREPRPDGGRLGVLSNAGGLAVLAADVASAEGLSVPLFSHQTRERLAAHVHGTVGTSNPVDAGAAVDAEGLAAAVDVVLGSGEVDAVVVELVRTALTDLEAVLGSLGEARARHPDRCCVVVVHGTPVVAPGSHGLTFMTSAGAAVRAIGRAARYSAWLAERTADIAGDLLPPVAPASRTTRQALARTALGASAGSDGWVGTGESVDLLAEFGLGPTGRVVRGSAAATYAAADVGFPVAVKVADAAVVHRTERGLVRVGLVNAAAVGEAVTSFERELGRRDVPVLVQPVLEGVEMTVGVVRDPSIGPLVMVGAGGVATELLADRAYLLPPVRRSDVRRALRSLRCWPLLTGFRGAPPADVDALVDVVVACGRLAEEVPEVAELDANPVMVSATGCGLVDVKLRLLERTDGPGEARQLRRTR